MNAEIDLQKLVPAWQALPRTCCRLRRAFRPEVATCRFSPLPQNGQGDTAAGCGFLAFTLAELPPMRDFGLLAALAADGFWSLPIRSAVRLTPVNARSAIKSERKIYEEG